MEAVRGGGGAYDAASASHEALKIQYHDAGGHDYHYDYTAYIPDLVTQLNINTDLKYSSAITGADNMALNITRGTFSYSGAADVLNVTVADGATVVGGTYTVNSMTGREADTYEEAIADTGKFTNHGTISAADADSSLSITGTLISDGAIRGIAGGTGGTVSVKGDADIAGSTVSLAGALPGESAAVLTASGTLTGEAANSSVTDIPAAATTGMLGYYGTVNTSGTTSGASTLTVHAVAQDNLGQKTAEEAAGYTAVQNLTAALAGDTRAGELRDIYAMDAAAAKPALARIAGGGLRGDIGATTQRSHLTNKLVAGRLHNLWKTHEAEITVPAPGTLLTKNVTFRTQLPEVDTNTWVNITKNWGELKGAASYHGQAISAGYDWASGQNSRAGVFVSHRASSLGADSSSASLHDTRVGYYTGSTHGAVERSLYADIGWQHSKTSRYLYSGLTARGRESSNLYEVGGRIGYDLRHDDGRTWHVVPYLAAQGSWLRQRGYAETGAGVFNHQVARDTSRYLGVQAGVSLERSIRSGSLTLDLGVRHAFSGGELYRSYRYEGDAGHSYTLSSSQDKTHGIASLTADTEFARGWHISANTTFERGAHDHDLSASLALKRMW